MLVPRFRLELGARDSEALAAVVESGALVQGAAVAHFEERVASAVGMAKAVATTNGFAALHLALLELTDSSRGGFVAMPAASTCFAVPNAILASGNRVRLFDLEVSTLDADPESLSRALGEEVDAIVAIGHFGLVPKISAFRERAQVPLIEDCAQSLLSRWRFGFEETPDLCVFSFYPTKGLVAIDGGMIAGDDTELLGRLRERVGYRSQDHIDDLVRFNYRLPNLHAALGLRRAADLDREIERRLAIRDRYDAVIRRRSEADCAPQMMEGEVVPQKYVLRFASEARASRFLLAMATRGVEAAREMIFLGGEGDRSRYRGAWELTRRLVSIPFFASLSEEEVSHVCRSLEEATRRT